MASHVAIQKLMPRKLSIATSASGCSRLLIINLISELISLESSIDSDEESNERVRMVLIMIGWRGNDNIAERRVGNGRATPVEVTFRRHRRGRVDAWTNELSALFTALPPMFSWQWCAGRKK